MPPKMPLFNTDTSEFSSGESVDRHEWLMDVISDLRQYSQINDLPALADQLENALLICAVEMENLPKIRKSMMQVA